MNHNITDLEIPPESELRGIGIKGVSSGEMGAALKVLLGPDATGLSANTVSRLKRDWAKEYDGWRDASGLVGSEESDLGFPLHPECAIQTDANWYFLHGIFG